MAQLSLADAINRLPANENRLDVFVNGDENASYQTPAGAEVPSVQNFLAEQEAKINELGQEFSNDDGTTKIGGTWAGGQKTNVSSLGTAIGASLIGYSDSNVESTLDALSLNSTQRMHMKRVAHRLPLLFPDYDAIIATYGYTYIYPQGFAIDDVASEIHVMYGAVGGATAEQWVAVYDRATNAYKSCYGLGNTSSGEGLVVRYDGATRYAYARYTNGVVCKVDITVLPATRTLLPPVSTHNVGLYYELTYRDGRFLIEQNGAPVGVNISRTLFSTFDTSFNRTGSLQFDKIDTGFTGQADSVFGPFIPKRQGIALGDGFIATSHGGYIAAAGPAVFYAYQGIKLYNLSGERQAESIMNPMAMIGIMQANGMSCTRIENEGVVVDASGKVFTMYVHKGRTDIQPPISDGVVIFEEFSSSTEAIDFSSAVAPYPSYQQSRLMEGTFPRSADSVMVNPLTGAAFTTLEQILTFMQDTDLREIAFYSSAVNITDINGSAFPNTVLVTLSNANNATFFMSILGEQQTTDYIIFGDPGSRTQRQMTARGYFSELRIANTLQDSVNKVSRFRGAHYLAAEEDFLGLDAQSTGVNNNLNYGGGSGLFNAATNHAWYVAPNTTTLTGTLRMRLDAADGLTIVPSTSAQPNNNGEMLFEATSNTSITIRYKGTDGVVRSATLTLA